MMQNFQTHFPSGKFRVVFLRHGESEWNKENRFTGWNDVNLSEKGVEEAKAAGRVLKQSNFQFDQVYTSVLTRTIQTYNHLADELGCHYLPITKSWRLNGRHNGSLQGLNKTETAKQHGEAQMHIWRRSYDVSPPALDAQDPRNPANDRRYQGVPKDALPFTESLKDTVARVIPFWHDHIAKDILAGKSVLVIAHGDSIKSIVKQIDNLSEKDILELLIPTSVPLVYEFDENLKSVGWHYLGDQQQIQRQIEVLSKK